MVEGSGGEREPKAMGLPALAATTLDVAALYDVHAARLACFIRRLTGEGPHVEDLLHETFIVAMQRQGSFEGRAGAATWLFGIAANLCRHHHRGGARLRSFLGRLADELFAPAARPDETLARRDDAARAHRLLAKLPAPQREVFVLYEVEGLTCEEIAHTLEIPVGTVWTRLHHARARFKKRAGRAGEERS